MEHHQIPRKNEGHCVNPRKMEFGWAPLGWNESSDFSGLKASNMAKGKRNWFGKGEHNKNHQFEFEDD